jgi:hypothetical protein
MGIKDEYTLAERAAASLAAKYAKTHDWQDAARWYQAAHTHQAVREALKRADRIKRETTR